MPHDLMGKTLHVGDIVTVQAHVKEIHQTEEYCNVTLETSQPMYPGNTRSVLTLNAKQTIRIETRVPEVATNA